jgi:hypothetical protein
MDLVYKSLRVSLWICIEFNRMQPVVILHDFEGYLQF